MSFSAIVQADILSDALAPVTALVNECKMQVDSDGLQITAVDPANVGMVDMELDAAAAASWSADGDTLGLNLVRFGDVLGMADSDEMVHLDLDPETRTLGIAIGGLDYTQALIDPDSIRQEPDIPDLDLPATYVFEGRDIARAVTAADLCSDHLEIRGVHGGGLEFRAEGDTDDVTISVSGEDLLSRVFDGDETVASLFSLEYLEDMTGAMPADAEVSLLVGDEFPAKMRYSLADGGVSVTNLLAPRIQSE